MADEVKIIEISPRDGMSVSLGSKGTRKKVAYINSLSKTGLPQIDAVAFVHPRAVPENSDAEKVMAAIEKVPGVSYIGLIQTEVGCRRALATPVDECLILLATSDLWMRNFSEKNLKESVSALPSFFEPIKASGKTVRVLIGTAFGCPYLGEIPLDDIVQLVLKLARLGADEICLADTVGMATPRKVKKVFSALIGLSLEVRLAAHFHDTYGMGLANCLAAYEAGIRIFDASLGGLSRTPYGSLDLPLGYWNVPTEDLVHLFEEMGIGTNVNLPKLLKCVELAEEYLGAPLPGHILRASRCASLYKQNPPAKNGNP